MWNFFLTPLCKVIAQWASFQAGKSLDLTGGQCPDRQRAGAFLRQLVTMPMGLTPEPEMPPSLKTHFDQEIPPRQKKERCPSRKAQGRSSFIVELALVLAAIVLLSIITLALVALFVLPKPSSLLP